MTGSQGLKNVGFVLATPLTPAENRQKCEVGGALRDSSGGGTRTPDTRIILGDLSAQIM